MILMTTSPKRSAHQTSNKSGLLTRCVSSSIIGETRFFHRDRSRYCTRGNSFTVTNRAIRDLERDGLLKSEMRDLAFGGAVKLIWHRAYRFQKRRAERLLDLINEYSAPNIGGALGLHGELMVLEGFAKNQFVMWGREVNEHGGVKWLESEHDLDFVFGRDGIGYGVSAGPFRVGEACPSRDGVAGGLAASSRGRNDGTICGMALEDR